jgi:hypothetical protein
MLWNGMFLKSMTLHVARNKVEKTFFIIALCSLFMGMRSISSEISPIEKTEYFSSNRKYVLKLIVENDGLEKPGHCQATLFEVVGINQKTIWSRYLINNYAPNKVFIADSGDYVITMDEWGCIGEFPVVIYGRRGELIRVHNTDSLGLKDDILHIRMVVGNYLWSEDSVILFSPDEEAFLIRLHWGKWIVLELKTGDLIEKATKVAGADLSYDPKWNALEAYKRKALFRGVILMLSSDCAAERKTGAMVCGQEGFRKYVPELRKLLVDKEYLTTNVPKEWTKVYFVRKAAKNALICMGEKVDEVITEELDKGVK